MIKCELTSQIVELAPGGSTAVVLTLTNQSEIIDDFQVSFQPVFTPETVGMNPAWLTLSPVQFTLRPIPAGRGPVMDESQRTVRLNVKLPPDIEAGSYAGMIIVTAKSGVANSAQLPFNLVVSENSQQELELRPKEQTSRRRTEIYRVDLVNRGNAPHTYAVYAEDEQDDCLFEVRPAEVTLLPREEASFTLRVRPRRRNWTDDDQRYQFQVKLEGYDSYQPGLFVQRCALPPVRWIQQHWLQLGFIFAFLLALLVAAFIFLFPLFSKEVKAAYCGPVSERYVAVTSDNVNTTTIRVSGRGGSEAQPVIFKVSSISMPGVFSSLISISPDGRRLAYVTARNLALDDAHIRVVDLLKVDPVSGPALIVDLPVPNGMWPTAPVWSSNGQRIAFFMRPVQTEVAATTAAATTANPNVTGSPSVTGTITTTQATTTAATTTTASGTPGATVGNRPGQLELWVAEPDAGKDSIKKLATPDGLTTALFYGLGNHDPNGQVVCWATDNQSLLVRPRPDDKTTSTQLQVALADGKSEKINLKPALSFIALPTAGAIQSLPKAAFLLPAASLIPPPVAQAKPSPSPTGPATKTSPTQAGSSSDQHGCAITKAFSQNDPQWSNSFLKKGNASKLGEWGCPIVAGAILLNYQGLDTTPKDLNTCLNGQGVGDNLPLNGQGWTDVGEQCGNNQLPNGVRGDFDWDKLDNALENGPAIVGLIGGPSGLHFVVVTSGHSGQASTYGAVDPWDGTTDKTLDDFIGWGYRPRWLISYDKGVAKGCGSGTQADLSRRPAGLGDLRSADNPVQISVTGLTDGAMYNETQTFQYHVDGANSASATISRTINGQTTTLSQPRPDEITRLTDEGVYTILIQASDRNKTLVATHNLQFTIDHTPPSILPPSFSPPLADQVNHRSNNLNQRMQLTAGDALTGIATIEYRINSGPWQIYSSDTATEPYTFDKPGTYNIAYYVLDGAGNTNGDQNNPNLYSFTIVPPGNFVPGANQATPGSFQSPLTPAGQPKPGGTTGQGNNSLTPPTAVSVPTATPRPAVRSTVPPTATAPAATTQVITPSIQAPLPTTESLTPQVSVTPNPSLAATPTVTISPTTTPVPVAGLSFNPSQLTFDVNQTSQSFNITNNGNVATTWTLTPGDSSIFLNFSLTTGYLAPNATANVIINTINPNPITVDQTTAFQVSATNLDPQTINVTIKAKPIPIASLVTSLTDGSSLPPTVTLGVTVTNSPLAQKPDHTVITATYKTCPNCDATSNTITRTTAIGNSLLVWDTTTFVPQTGIQIGGQICVSQDESNCTNLQTTATNLKIELGATFLSPTTKQLTDTVKIKMQPSVRTKSIVLSYTATDNTGQQAFATLPISGTWEYNWDTLGIAPDLSPYSAANTVTLSASACDINAICQDNAAALTGLFTKMQASAQVTKPGGSPLASNDVLNGILVIQETSFSRNVDHLSAWAIYTDTVDGPVIAHPVGQVQNNGSANWDTSTVPVRSNIKLEIRACYGPTDLWCDLVVAYNGLQTKVGAPVSLEPVDGFQSALINQPFNNPLRVVAKDAQANPVPGVQVTFTAPDYFISPAIPSGIFSSTKTINEVVTTDGTGTATSSLFTANNNPGAYQVIASAPGITQTAQLQLFNNLPNQKQILVQAGDLQTAKINTRYQTSLQVQALDPNQNPPTPVQGALLVFEVQNSSSGAGGIFSNGTSAITVTTDVKGSAAISLTANLKIGTFQVLVSGAGFNPNIFTLSNVKGDPATVTVASNSYKASAKGLYSFVLTNTTSSFQATVTDAGGYTLDNIPVTFSAPSSLITATGTFTNPIPTPPTAPSGATSATVTTDANGVASSPLFFANLKLGTYPVAVQAGAIVAANQINVTNQPGDPSLVTFETMPPGPLQLKTNASVSNVFTATVFDLGNNRVPNATVTFSITSTNGSSGTFASDPATATTNALGLAVLATKYTPNCSLGDYQLQATAASPITVQPGTYALSNVVGGAAKIAINNGSSSQAITVGSTTPYSAFNVIVTDGCSTKNNPVSGANLSFDVPITPTIATGTFSGGVSSVQVTSASDGTATVSGLLPNTVAGKFDLTVTLLNGTQPANVVYKLTNNPDVPSVITPSNSSLVTIVGQSFPPVGTPLTVTVVDRFNNPVAPGTTVTFSTPAYNSTTPNATAVFGTWADTGPYPNSKTATTDANGNASAGPISASKKDGTYNLTIAAGSVTKNVVMTNNAGPPHDFLALGATSYNTIVNTAFTGVNFNVKVRDIKGNPIAGASVTYTPQVVNGASADFHTTSCASPANSPETLISDSSGIVTVTDVLCANGKAGSYTLKVTSGAATALNFNLTNKPGAPDHFSPATNSFTTTVNTKFTGTLGVQVQDANNNPVGAGVSVTYTVLPSGGAGADFGSCGSGTTTSTGTTDGSGNITPANLCANKVAGSYTLNITGAANPATFNLTNTADVPSVVSISPTSFNLTVGTSYPNVTITVKDQFGNPVPGATASFQTSGNTNGANVAIGTTLPPVSDATGIITVTSTSGYLKANSKTGTYTLNAKATVGGNSASTNPDPVVTQTADVPRNITANPAINTVATVGTAYSPATLSVKVTDQYGNPVADGTNVTFAAPSSGASGTFGGGATTTVTTTNGIATTGGTFTANNVVGQYEVAVSAGAASSPAGSFIYTNRATLVTDYNANSATNRNTVAGDTVPIEVQVVDGSNNPVSGGTLTFSVGNAANGQFSNNNQSITVVNSSGTVSTNFTTGSTIGQIQVTATLTIATGVTVQKIFNLYNGANITITGGNNQTILVNGDTSAALTVQVTGNGTFGVGVPGVTVNYAVTSGNGTVASGTATTNGSGNASTTFTSSSGQANIGSVNVDASITISASLKPKQTFDLTNSFNLSISGGDGQTAPNTTTFANTLAVKAVGFGNTPIPGLLVSFAIQANAGNFKQNGSNVGTTVTKNTNSTPPNPIGVADLKNAPAGRIDLVAGSTAGPLQIIASITQNTVTQTVTFNETVT